MIGIDFDNTIVDYSNIFSEYAYHLGYVSTLNILSKENIKKIIFKLPEGKIKWGILQAEVYSEGIVKAKIMDGFSSFIHMCRSNNIPVSIVSHKTIYNKYDTRRRNLRKSAMKWILENEFYDQNNLGFKENQIYFEDTPMDKIKRIKKLKCTHFIDDLMSILLHPKFPSNVVKILLNVNYCNNNHEQINVCKNWKEIAKYEFISG